ncbi:hypothetical protein SRHO_G00188310 [Serrasalmus rhombeus]
MEEMKDLSATLKEKAGSLFWIGLEKGNTGKWQRSLAEGNFYSERDAYRNWSLGEPNSTWLGTWLDDDRNTPRKFMCYDGKQERCRLEEVSSGSACLRPTNSTSSAPPMKFHLKSLTYLPQNSSDLTARSAQTSDARPSCCLYYTNALSHNPCRVVRFSDGLAWLYFSFEKSVCGVSASVPYQYLFVNKNKTWTEAQSYCRQNYTDLVSINNMEEMKKLNATLKDTPRSLVWIGLEKGNTGKWQWSLAEGNVPSERDAYRNWSPGEPNNSRGKELCVAMKKTVGTWIDDDCNTPRKFMCYDEKKTNTERYILIYTEMTWRDAQSYCRNHYTDLASVRNQTENQEIKTAAQAPQDYYLWIGLFNDSWKWSDQSTSSFRYWAPKQPDNYDGNENCAAVSVTTPDTAGGWYDVNCEVKIPFICHENKLILIKQNLTWREALRYCRVKHVDLVSVHSEEIQLWVKEVAQNASTEHVWLGLRHTCTLSFWF